MGEFLALVSAFCFAASNVTVARGAGSKGQDNGAFLSILITTVIAGIVWMHNGLRDGWSLLNTEGMLWFAAAGALTIFIGRVFLYASVQHLGAVRASAVKRLNPLFSVLLGVSLLGEPLGSSMLLGMLLIFSSFGLLVKHSLASAASSGQAQSWMATLRNLGFFYGPVSALAYAVGYVARKQGLIAMPDAAFGTMFGSVTGAVIFVVVARFADSYRQALRSVFTTFNPWLFAAGVLGSMGQLLYFSALTYSTISRVALITSMEVFVTMFLTVVVFRSREQLGMRVLLAAGLGVAGTFLIILR